MRSMSVAFLVATMSCMFSPLIAAEADPVVLAAQSVIQKQIEAFLRNDADTAYGFAAPGIKARYPDKAAFFAMVRKNYEAVYHPGNYAFGRGKSTDDGRIIVQELMITGDDGKNWKAFYKMLRDTDGSYKIEGVMMMPDLVSKGI